jgi:hypothetical protein
VNNEYGNNSQNDKNTQISKVPTKTVGIKQLTPTSAVEGEQAFKIFEARWRLVIPFHLFGGYCGSPILSEPSGPRSSLSQIAGQRDSAFARRRGCSGENADTNILPAISALNRIRQRAVLGGG